MSLVTNYGFSQTYKCRNKKPNLLPCEKMIILVYQVTVREVASLGGLPQISKQLHTLAPPGCHTITVSTYRNSDVKRDLG